MLFLGIHLNQNKIKMTIEQLESLVNLHGSREMSNRLINSRINKIIGLDMRDLPDTSELCDVIDELDELLQSKNYSIQEIKDVLDTINIDFIQEMVLG